MQGKFALLACFTDTQRHMKTKLLSFVALGAVVFATVLGAADDHSKSATAASAQKPTKLFKIATINGAQAVREFDHNVQVLKAERQQWLELQAAYNIETDAKKKKELKTKVDAATAKFESDSATMNKTYRFTLARNYEVEVEAINIYVQVTDEEAATIEAEQKAAAQKDAKAKT